MCFRILHLLVVALLAGGMVAAHSVARAIAESELYPHHRQILLRVLSGGMAVVGAVPLADQKEDLGNLMKAWLRVLRL